MKIEITMEEFQIIQDALNIVIIDLQEKGNDEAVDIVASLADRLLTYLPKKDTDV